MLCRARTPSGARFAAGCWVQDVVGCCPHGLYVSAPARSSPSFVGACGAGRQAAVGHSSASFASS